MFSGAALADARRRGGRTQRLLWASTGTKNPHYRDVLYVEELIGPDTVNTMPPATLDAFRDHGRPRASLVEDVDSARDTHGHRGRPRHLDEGGHRPAAAEGVRLFADAFEKLLEAVDRQSREAGAGGSTA